MSESLSSADFARLLADLQQGNNEAAQRVVDRYSTQLLRLAQGRLSTLLRSKEGPEDVVQSVYRSFFRRHRDGEFRIENWESLWGLLSLLTLRKCARRAEHYLAKKRNAARDVPLAPADESSAPWQPVGREPSPDDALMLIETIEHVLAPFGERDQEIVRLRLRGHSTDEIASMVGRSQYTVQSVLRRVKRALERSLSESDESDG